MHYFCKSCVFSWTVVFVAVPFGVLAAPAAEALYDVFPTVEYVVPTYQGTAYNGDIMQVNNSGYLEHVTPVSAINTNVNTDDNIPTSKKAVTDFAVQKPASAAAGKVLTYNGNEDTRPTAQYIKVPVADGDPNASGTNFDANNPFVSIWFQ